jgi:hypothetical protein
MREGAEDEDEEELRTHVVVHDIKPPFLDGRVLLSKQVSDDAGGGVTVGEGIPLGRTYRWVRGGALVVLFSDGKVLLSKQVRGAHCNGEGGTGEGCCWLLLRPELAGMRRDGSRNTRGQKANSNGTEMKMQRDRIEIAKGQKRKCEGIEKTIQGTKKCEGIEKIMRRDKNVKGSKRQSQGTQKCEGIEKIMRRDQKM